MEVHHWEEYICGDDKHWLVDLDTDEWIRVVVEEEPGFERGSGKWEPQVYIITAIHLFDNYPRDLYLGLGREFFLWPSNRWPTYDRADEVPFDKWLEDEDNQQTFISCIKEIVKYQMEGMTNLFDQISGV